MTTLTQHFPVKRDVPSPADAILADQDADPIVFWRGRLGAEKPRWSLRTRRSAGAGDTVTVH